MIANIVTFILLIGLSLWIAESLAARHNGHYIRVFRNLIWYHAILSLTYYIYAVLNPSDSLGYYYRVVGNYRGDTWYDFYGVSTTFIEFVGYPLIKYLQLSYESMMMVFAWFGLLGFFFFYIFIKERIHFKHTIFGFDLVLVVFFLPNLHFWSASFGKGSIILLGLGLFFYGISKIDKRFLAIIVGAFIVYHVRPHILFILLAATALGFTFSTKGISWTLRIFIVFLAVIAFNFIYADVMTLIGFETEELISGSTNLTKRVKELSDANSGVDISNYSFPLKLFTFLFRPLFVDAPGTLGLIVSFENLFYLVVFFKILRLDFIAFFVKSNYLVKTTFIAFFTVSAALAQISSNLGLAMRQKSQVMILMMFVILQYLDDKKMTQYRRMVLQKKIQARLKAQAVAPVQS